MSAGERLQSFEVLQVIGSGSFGKILVWKELKYGKMSDKEKQLLVSEVNILREFRHPHIVRYYDRIIDKQEKKIYIIMELCEGGDLASVIKHSRRERKHIEEDFIWRMFLHTLLALKECHNRSEGAVLHRDLKPSNILLDSQQNAKLGDFGLARVLSASSMFARTHVGTPFYMSPEQVNETPYNYKSDIWSLGCLVYEMAALSPPFEATNEIALGMKIRAGHYRPIPSTYSEDLKKAVALMLQVEQSRRPTVDELLSLPPLAIRVKERKINQHYNLLKKKEEDLRKREEEIEAKEKELEEREKEIELREKELGIKPSYKL